LAAGDRPGDMITDLELARRVIDGQEAACEQLFADQFPRLYRFARARLHGDDQAAEEIVQATLVVGIRRLHTYRGEAALFTWLCTVCRREIAAWLERAGRRAEVSLAEDHPDVRAALDSLAAAAAGALEQEAGRRELSRLVQMTLDHLPARYAQALEWKYIEGQSVSEVASRLGLGYKATESLLARARDAFREGFTPLAGIWPVLAPQASGPGEP
jgi:RNA polymerase sigma-70 factor (ECF subfamily)